MEDLQVPGRRHVFQSSFLDRQENGTSTQQHLRGHLIVTLTVVLQVGALTVQDLLLSKIAFAFRLETFAEASQGIPSACYCFFEHVRNQSFKLLGNIMTLASQGAVKKEAGGYVPADVQMSRLTNTRGLSNPGVRKTGTERLDKEFEMRQNLQPSKCRENVCACVRA